MIIYKVFIAANIVIDLTFLDVFCTFIDFGCSSTFAKDQEKDEHSGTPSGKVDKI